MTKRARGDMPPGTLPMRRWMSIGLLIFLLLVTFSYHFGEPLFRCLQLLQANDVGLCLSEPAQQDREPAIDAVHVVGGDLHGTGTLPHLHQLGHAELSPASRYPGASASWRLRHHSML